MLWEKPISLPQEEIMDFLLFMRMCPWLLAAEKLCTPAASSSEKELVFHSEHSEFLQLNS